jgi:hypothetical protein
LIAVYTSLVETLLAYIPVWVYLDLPEAHPLAVLRFVRQLHFHELVNLNFAIPPIVGTVYRMDRRNYGRDPHVRLGIRGGVLGNGLLLRIIWGRETYYVPSSRHLNYAFSFWEMRMG